MIYRLIISMLFPVLSFGANAAPAEQQSSARTQMAQLQSMVATLAEDDIGLMARVHYATHTGNFDRARDFYRQLGWTEGNAGFPLTNTHLMARALGMYDICQYELVKGEVISLPGSVNTANIDLLQFKNPFNPDPPYKLPNHIGMAYASLLTTNLESDVAFLKSIGVEFLYRAIRHSWKPVCLFPRC